MIYWILCKLGIHFWEHYDVQGYENRRCQQCGKAQIFYNGAWIGLWGE